MEFIDIYNQIGFRPSTINRELDYHDIEFLSNHKFYYNGSTKGGDRIVISDLPIPDTNTSPIPFVNIYNNKICDWHVFFYEITITGEVDNDWNDCISIGLVPKNYPLKDVQPGWGLGSYGYHSDDGQIFNNNISTCGKKFTCGDTVGCGVDYVNKLVFFTHNQTIIGTREYVVKNNLYPGIGIDSPYHVEVNFGKKDFVFDIVKYNDELSGDYINFLPSNIVITKIDKILTRNNVIKMIENQVESSLPSQFPTNISSFFPFNIDDILSSIFEPMSDQPMLEPEPMEPEPMEPAPDSESIQVDESNPVVIISQQLLPESEATPILLQPITDTYDIDSDDSVDSSELDEYIYPYYNYC